jgi:hypothetical protein
MKNIIISDAHILAILPDTLIDLTILVNKFSIAVSLAIEPHANVIAAVGVDETTISMVIITKELSFVNCAVNFLTYATDFTFMI